MNLLRFKGIISASTQHQISTFPVNKVACSLLSESGEIKLFSLEKLPQKHLAHTVNMQPPSWQKIDQIQNGSDKAQNTQRKLRDRTWIPAITSESRSLRGGCKQDTERKKKEEKEAVLFKKTIISRNNLPTPHKKK